MRWIAYVSDESGSNEIFVQGISQASGTLRETGGKWQVSMGGGMGPRWSSEGKELYYRASDGKVMVVEVAPGAVFQAGAPRVLFPAPLDILAAMQSTPIWDVAADGSRFLLAITEPEPSPTPFTVVLNWTALLKR